MRQILCFACFALERHRFLVVLVDLRCDIVLPSPAARTSPPGVTVQHISRWLHVGIRTAMGYSNICYRTTLRLQSRILLSHPCASTSRNLRMHSSRIHPVTQSSRLSIVHTQRLNSSIAKENKCPPFARSQLQRLHATRRL